MPIYEYQCEACGNQFEKLAKNSDDHPAECPACHAPHPRKQLSTFTTASAAQKTECPAAAECPTGSCCTGGSCAV